MKNIFYLSSLMVLLTIGQAMAQEESTKIKVRITDKSGKVLEKEYSSEEALTTDPELKEMGVEVEAENGKVRLKSDGNQNQVVIIQKKGGGNHLYMQQGPGPGPDSAEMHMRSHPNWPSHPPMNWREEESLSEEELQRWKEWEERRYSKNPDFRKEQFEEDFQRMMDMRDSLLSQRFALREERMEEMHRRREEMHRRMEERREGFRKEKELIIIEDPTKKEVAHLGLKNNTLELEELRIFPDTDQEILQLTFKSQSNTPVTVRLSDLSNRLLLDETYPLSGKNLEKTIELQDFGKGTYFLQIIQKNKSLIRKITIQ